MMKVDEICERYASKKVGLTIKLLEEDDPNEKPSMVLVEGHSDALKLLGELFLAMSEKNENDGFAISPFGAGKVHFSSLAELGIYINCIK